MGRSRLSWAGKVAAPWALALGLTVAITAQADQEPDLLVNAAGAAASAGPSLIYARLELGDADELSAIPDEIEPNAAFKPKHAALPAINRADKGDPFIVLRRGFDAQRHASVVMALGEVGDEAADAATSPSSPKYAEAHSENALASALTDGATPSLPLDFAFNSLSPGPSDGKIVDIGPGGQPLLSDAGTKPNYAALIDVKDSPRQMRCLAEAIYFEARSEPETGQAGVAQVVLNRVRSGIFPTDVCGVVYQDRNRPFACQFSFACEGKSLRIEEPEAWATATRIAKEVATGVSYDPKLAEAVNYHAAYVYPFWAPSLKRVERIGAHIFYAMRPGLYWAPGALNGRGDLPPADAQAAPAPVSAQAMAAAPTPPARPVAER